MAEWMYAFLLGAAERKCRAEIKAGKVIPRDRLRFLSGFMSGVGQKLTREATRNSQQGLVWTGDPDLRDHVNRIHPHLRSTSVRSVIGAELSGAIDMGWREKLALQFRLGWVHEYADTSRPVTASFAGAPGIGYTVYGAAPQRDAAVIGLAANTAVTSNASLYLRYDGEIGAGTDSHVLSAGFRMTW